MKSLFKVLLGVLFLGSIGIAMADEDDRGDHDRVRVIVVPKRHHHRRHYFHPKPHSQVDLHIGIGEHHDDHHDDHPDDHR